MSAIHLGAEIIESQKARSDLLKWKIIVVATIVSVGLGITEKNEKFELALCVIPFVMAYIDALCIHLNLRILSIAKWHTTNKAKELESNLDYKYMREYEKYTHEAWKAGAFNLEKWTIFFSSVLINLALILAAVFDVNKEIFEYGSYIYTCGTIGLLVTIAINIYLYVTKRKIRTLEFPATV